MCCLPTITTKTGDRMSITSNTSNTGGMAETRRHIHSRRDTAAGRQPAKAYVSTNGRIIYRLKWAIPIRIITTSFSPRTPLNGRILSDNVTTPRVHYSSIKVDCGRLSAVGIHHHGGLLLGWNHVVSVLSIVQWRRLVPFEEENKAERLTY